MLQLHATDNSKTSPVNTYSLKKSIKYSKILQTLNTSEATVFIQPIYLYA
jgi:hypothetical protein